MPLPRLDQLEVSQHRRTSRGGSRLWREWCFARVAFRHFRLRFVLMALILIGGALLFRIYEPDKNHSFQRAIYFTWSLILNQSPEEFPQSIVLRAMFFIFPILGLTVIIEGIVDFALMLRDRRRYERSWCTMLASSFSDHIVLVGLGKLGYRIFIVLRRLGEAVVVVERNPNNEFLEEIRRDGSPLLVGDARREALLAEANIAKARSIILSTDDDLANLETALDAQHINPSIRVVLRMFDQNMADKFSHGFNIHLAASPSALSAPTFATSAVAPAIVSSFVLGNQLVAMQRWTVRTADALCGQTIGEITSNLKLGVIEHTRPPDGPRLFPSPDVHLESGDEIILQGPLHLLADLRGEFAAV